MLIFFLPSLCFAGRYWDESEKPTLDVYNDFALYTSTCRYVDPINGQDGTGGHDGTTFGKAWKTLAYATDHYMGRVGPGYTLRLSSGVYLRQSPDTQGATSGGAAGRLYIGPYGNGEVILDRRLPTAWVQDSLISTIWYSTMTADVRSVIEDDVPMMLELSSSTLSAGRYYVNNTDGSGYKAIAWIWCSDGGSPDSHDIAAVEDYLYSNAIFINNASSITIYGLTIKYGGGKGVEVLGPYNHVVKCDIKFPNSACLSNYNDGTMYSTGTHFQKNHCYYGYMENWPRGRNFPDGGWGQGISGFGSSYQLNEGNIVEYAGGEGMGCIGCKNLTFRDNIISNSWSMLFYPERGNYVTIERNFLYNSITSTEACYNNGLTGSNIPKAWKRLWGSGLNISDEGSTSRLATLTICRSSCTFTWSTDASTTSRVDYGLSSSYTNYVENLEEGTTHSITITGLSDGTLYHYNINQVSYWMQLSSDHARTTTPSGDWTFTTRSADGYTTSTLTNGSAPPMSNNSIVRNNIFINVPTGISYLGENLTPWKSQFKNAQIYNNTVIPMNRYFFNADPVGFNIPFSTCNYNISIRNNIVYVSSSAYAIYMSSAASREPFYQHDWTNNIFYADINGRSQPFLYGSSATAYPTWIALDSPAQNSGGSYDNPDLYDVQWTNFYSSMTYLTAGSPAINAGADLSAFFTDDFFEATRNIFDIGAHEYDGTTGGTENTPKRMWWFKGGMFK